MMQDDDFKLLRGFADKRMYGQTFVIVESLSRLKIIWLMVKMHYVLWQMQGSVLIETFVEGWQHKWSLKIPSV